MEDPPPRPRNGHSRAGSMASRRASQIIEAAQPASKDFAIGCLLLLVVVFMWTTSTFAVQIVIESGYDKPFFLTYMSTGSFAFYLFPSLWKLSKQSTTEIPNEDPHRLSSLGDDQPLLTPPEEAELETEIELLDQAEKPLTVRETAKLAFLLCFFWFSTVWLISIALKYTSVGSATVLSNTTGLFTMAMSRLAAIEKLTKYKIVAVLTSLAGISLVSLSDSSSASPPAVDASSQSQSTALLGDIFALCSAVFYALYVVVMKLKVGSESRVDTTLLFGFIGLWDIVLYWIPGVALHFLGIEPFQIPKGGKVIFNILLNNIFNAIATYIYALALLKTTPLVATVGGTLGIPLAVLGDVVRGRPTKFAVFLGASLVVISPIMVALSENEVRKKDEFWSESAQHRRRSRSVSVISSS